MKKAMILLLCAALTLGLAACGRETAARWEETAWRRASYIVLRAV